MASTPELLVADIRDELAWERERLVAGRLHRPAALLHAQVDAFLAWVDGLEPDG